MGITVDKQGKINIGLGAVISAIVAVASAYPTARAALGQALQKQIETQIQREIKPLKEDQAAMKTAQIITISATVRNLQNAIVALEFKRDMCGNYEGSCWTIRDAQDLTSLRNDLRAAEDALKVLK